MIEDNYDNWRNDISDKFLRNFEEETKKDKNFYLLKILQKEKEFAERLKKLNTKP